MKNWPLSSRSTFEFTLREIEEAEMRGARGRWNHLKQQVTEYILAPRGRLEDVISAEHGRLSRRSSP